MNAKYEIGEVGSIAAVELAPGAGDRALPFGDVIIHRLAYIVLRN